MADLDFFARPRLQRTVLVAAFAGWPDASESATRAAKYLIRELRATRFAAIDPEEFFDFTQLRPDVSTGRDRQRVLSWPKNEFYAWHSAEDAQRDLVVFVGAEPHLRWRRFSSLVMEVADACEVELMVTLGALLDAVPHTRPSLVTKSATTEKLGDGFESLKFGPARYEGPTGIMSVVIEAMARRDVPVASLWGHAPHYLQVRPNPPVTLALLQSLQPFVPHPIKLTALERAAADFADSVARALSEQSGVREYVTQLEERYDSGPERVTGTESAVADADQLVAEVEEFLRRSQNDEEGRPPIGEDN